MKKFIRHFLLLVASGSIIFGLTACSQEDDTILWRIGSADPESYYMTAMTIDWAEKISERSGGRIETQVYVSGSLGSDSDMMDSLAVDSLQVWEGGSNVANMMSPAFDAWGLLYLYESREQQHRFWDEHFDEVSDMLAEETGYRLLAVIDGPNRELTSTVPVESVDDLTSYKLRVPEISTYINCWDAIGAAPTAMALSEVFTSLQLGVIEGQENDILLSESSGFFDVCKYLVMTEHSAYEGFVVVTEKMWQSLPEDLQEIVRECSQELMVESREEVQILVDDCMARLEDEYGVTIIYPDTTQIRERVEAVYEEYDHVQEIVDMIRSS